MNGHALTDESGKTGDVRHAKPMRVIAVVQARMGSTRLAGKSLMPLAGQPVVQRVMQRIMRARTVDQVILATTCLPEDDPLQTLAQQQGYELHRGAQRDVLDRFYQLAVRHDADLIVRLAADRPLVDPSVIDHIVEHAIDHPEADYVSNILPSRSYPIGLDVEVISRSAIEKLHEIDLDLASREGVTDHIHDHPEQWQTQCVIDEQDRQTLRWVLDWPEDYELMRQIYDHFANDDFHWHQVIELLEQHPQWASLNAHLRESSMRQFDSPP